MGWGKLLLNGGKIVATEIVPGVLKIGGKISDEFIEKQKSLIKIPDLKDIHVDEAIRVLKEELALIPTTAVANPKLEYANRSENEVVYSEPKFGSRVNPKTMVKVYYLTQEVIEKSNKLMGNKVREFKVPIVIGLNLYEAREDLEGLGLKVTPKIEKPSIRYCTKEDGQVTRITYPNNQKIGPKLHTSDRVWLYYVSEEVIAESKLLKHKKVLEGQERIGKIEKVAKEIYKGVVETPKTVADNIWKPFSKKEERSGKNKE